MKTFLEKETLLLQENMFSLQAYEFDLIFLIWRMNKITLISALAPLHLPFQLTGKTFSTKESPKKCC